jgi:hypothetical protein
MRNHVVGKRGRSGEYKLAGGIEAGEVAAASDRRATEGAAPQRRDQQDHSQLERKEYASPRDHAGARRRVRTACLSVGCLDDLMHCATMRRRLAGVHRPLLLSHCPG